VDFFGVFSIDNIQHIATVVGYRPSGNWVEDSRELFRLLRTSNWQNVRTMFETPLSMWIFNDDEETESSKAWTKANCRGLA